MKASTSDRGTDFNGGERGGDSPSDGGEDGGKSWWWWLWTVELGLMRCVKVNSNSKCIGNQTQ